MLAPQRFAEADLHVHSEWSWDAPRGSMDATCAQAQELGLKALAFTEHADYSELCEGARLNVEGYLDAVDRCRKRFPGLSILTGVELGEPHRHQMEVEAVLGRGRFDTVLGSVHSVLLSGATLEFSELGPEPAVDPQGLMQGYCEELVALIDSPIPFEILAHLEYPRRFWPATWPRYESSDYRDILQEVLAAATLRGLTLEFNTTRGGSPDRCLCPAPEVLQWWREVGGTSVSFGSDAHDPTKVGAGFEVAARLASQAGFEPSLARLGIWSKLSAST
ncbi:MAG: histidinol-phosphatase HisJ family protein [Candidatus Dormiibacterota bacterium]